MSGSVCLAAYILRYFGQDYEGKSILALGCGIGITEIDFTYEQLTGVDIFDYSEHFHGKFIQADVKDIKELFEEDSFDYVIGVDIIEHLEKEEGFQLLKDAEAIAQKLVYFYTPIEWSANEQESESWGYGNPALDHKSLWTPYDFNKEEFFSVLPFPKTDSGGYVAVKNLVG